MEAYNVLAEIYAAEGNEERAGFFTEVTRSIREGEMADEYLYAGLVSEAVTRYREALGHFEDAYCLQSRLAKTLAQQGKMEEAQVHFEKAFELMPVSFGPVESHCFGCEGIFEEKISREIAERVFKKFIADNPDNPRTYYLLGMVYQQKGQPDEAFGYFLEAFNRDPFYYNCALKIEDYLWSHPELLKEHQQTLKKILEITPYNELPYRFAERVDLMQAWLDADAMSRDEVHPLSLELVKLPFTEESPQARRWFYTNNRIKAISGWSREDLLRSNNFLSRLSSL